MRHFCRLLITAFVTVLLLFVAKLSFGQLIINNTGSSSVLQREPNRQVTGIFIIPVYADTTAPLAKIDSLGMIIQIRTTGKVYKRDTANPGHKWTEIGSGGGGSTDTTSLSARINLKVDSVTIHADTAYYWQNGVRHFAFKSTISLATMLSVLGYVPLSITDTSTLISSRLFRQKGLDSLAAVLNALIAAKVTTGANGVTDSLHTIILGGEVYKNTTVSLAAYNKQLWVKLATKTSTDSNATSQLIVGDTNFIPVSTTSTFGNGLRNSAIAISKGKTNNNENNILFSMTTGDAGLPNGWQFQNYTDVAGEVQPRLVTYSSATGNIRHGYTHISYMKGGTVTDPGNTAFVFQAINYDSTKSGAPVANRDLKRTTLFVFENNQRHAFVLDSLENVKIGDTTTAGSVSAFGQLDLFNNGRTYAIYQRDPTSKNLLRGPLLLGPPANAATGDFILLRNATDSTVKQLGIGSGLAVVSNNLVVSGGGGGSAAGFSGSVQIKSATTGSFGYVPNFIGDSVTKKVSSDTLSSHTNRQDSAKFNYYASWPFPNVLEGYGHSMMAGLSVLRYFYFNTVQPFPDSSFRNKFANRLSIPDYNHGYSGIGAMDAAMIGIKYQNPINRALTIVMDGWNNIQNVTPVVPNTYNKIINSNKFLWVNGNLKMWKPAGSADSVTTYGTWTTYTNTATAASPNSFLSVPLSETKSGSLSRQTTTINDSIVWTSPTDSTVVVELLGWKLSGSTVQVFIDGVSKGTWNTNSQTDSVNTDIFVLGKVTYPLIFTGLSMTSHKVKVVNTTAGKLVVDFFGTLRDAKYSYPFILVHDPDHGGTKTNIVLNNGKQDSLVSTIQVMGYPAITFATNTYLNAATDIASDSIHPNNSGHRHMDSGMSIVYLTHVPQGENGTVVFSNSLHVRNSDASYGYRRLANTSDFNRFYGSIPDNLTQDQYTNLNRHHFNFTDSGSGSFVRLPNLAIADSSSNTYVYLNARNRLTDNGFGLRIFSSAPSSIPDFILIGGNGNNFGGSTTTSRQGATIALDTRGVTAPIRFLAHETGTVTDAVAGAIHGSGGWDIGGADNLDSANTWFFFKPGTATRSQIKFGAMAIDVTSPRQGDLWFNALTDALNFRHNGVTTNLLYGGGGAGVTRLSPIDSATKGANGAVINGNSLMMQSADASFPGAVTTAAQIFAGQKTFNAPPKFLNLTTAPASIKLMAVDTVTGLAYWVSATTPTGNIGDGWPLTFTRNDSLLTKTIKFANGSGTVGSSADSGVTLDISSSIAFGAYAPTTSNLTNTSSVTSDSSTYTKSSYVVTGRFSGNLTPTTGVTSVLFDFVAPVVNTTWNTGSGSGSGMAYDNTTGISVPVRAYFSSSGNIRVAFLPATTNIYSIVINYQYDSR